MFDADYHWTIHNENGWINEDSFIKYLKHLKEYFFNDDEIHVILDIYKAFMTEYVKEMAQGLNIKLEYILVGMTD